MSECLPGLSAKGTPRVAAVILAAGASSRMGTPKALLSFRGETFVGRLVRIFSKLCDPVVVVTGYHQEQVRNEVGDKASTVVNPAPERGQLSSLQVALGSLPAGLEGFLFIPVDCPAVEESTVQILVESFLRRDPETLLVAPQYRGKHGHPVCAAASLAGELLALAPDGQARQVIRHHAANMKYIEVDDAGVVVDVDDPESYQRLLLTENQE